MTLIHIEHITDSSGNDGLIAYEVPDTFDAVAVYETFTAGFKAAHPTKSGRLTSRQLVTQAHQWIRHLDSLYRRVKHTHRN